MSEETSPLPFKIPKTVKEWTPWITTAYRSILLASIWSMKIAILSELDKRYPSAADHKAHIDADKATYDKMNWTLVNHETRIAHMEGELDHKGDRWYDKQNNQGRIGP